MSVPHLTKNDIIAILRDENIIDVEPQINGGQKAVIPVITENNKYLAKFIELPRAAFCSIGDDSENIEDVSLGRLKREIEILYKSNCENVVKVFSNKLNYIEYNNHNLYYYTEEYVDGSDVNKLLQDKYSFSIDEIFNLTEYINEIVELNSQIKNYIQQIKNFEDQLNCEKEKNKNLLNENSVLKEKIQKIENEINKIQEFQKPIKIGKDKMKKFKKKGDEKYKIFKNYNPLDKDNIQDKYYDLSKQKNELNNEILFIRNDKIKEDEIFNLNQKIKDLNRNIERYPYILNENENLLSIIFCTKNEKILFSMVCKSTDNIKILESKIYKKYPEISCFENYFTFKGIIIDKNESLEKNNINDGDLIIINH